MQPLEEKMEQQQEQLEQNEEMEQAQEQEQLEETPQDDAPEGYRIDFAVRYVDIFEGLEATDKADGTNKKPKRLFVILTLLMCAQVIWYAYSFSIVYQGNHVYVIPKSVLNVEQAQELASLMQQKAPQAYHDLTQK